MCRAPVPGVPAELFVCEEFDCGIWNDADTVCPVALHHAPNTFSLGHAHKTLQDRTLAVS